jgi:hypothetical protein
LNYQGVLVVMEMHGIKQKHRTDYFLKLQAMEIACLNEWAQNR